MDNNLLQISDIDLLLSLCPHGWSLARFTIGYEILEFDISHIFNDPYADTMDALLDIMKGQDSSFFWFSEPLGIKVELKIGDDNLIYFSIFDIEKEFYHYQEFKDEDLKLMKSFKTNFRQLLVLFYYQFKKTCILLEDKEYSANRSKDFPYQKFKEFEKQIINYLKK